MILAAVLALVQAQAKPTYTIGGDAIAVEVPTWKSPEPALPTVEVGGYRYAFDGGRLASKSVSGGGWDEVATPVPAVEKPLKWPTLFQLVNRVDIQTDVGHLLQRQGDIYTDDWRSLKREAALFCYLVSQYTMGKVAIEPTWRVDETLLFMEGEPWSEVAPKYLSPIVNATAEKPSEGPGPFASVMVLQPGFDRTVAVSRLDGSPVISLPVYAYFDRARPGQLARAMFNAWVVTSNPSVQATVVDFGMRFGEGILRLERPEDFGASSLLGTLPQIADSAVPPTGRATFVAGESIYVRPAYATLFATRFRAKGWTLLSGSPWIAFERGEASASATDAELLGVRPEGPVPEDAPTEVKFGPGEAEQLPTSGNFSAKTVADPERGSVGEIRETSFRRSGWVRLLGGFDASKTPYVEFMIKSRAAVWPVSVVVDSGASLGVFRLFGHTAGLPDSQPSYTEAKSFMVALTPDTGWKQVVLDLRSVGVAGRVRGVYLAAPAFAQQAVMSRSASAPALLFDDLAARAEPSGPVSGMAAMAMTEGASPTSDDPFARARFAHESTDQAALLKLLDDPYDLVKWNAADRFRTIKNPQAVPKLTEIARHYNPRLSQAGTLALANQGTETAIAAIRYNFQTALGDFSKMFGAQVMPAIDERKILADLAVGLNAHHPAARCEVVRAIARQPFKEASLVMMTFLNDTEPTVRLAVLQALPTKDATVLARVIGVARNDPSDDVRAAAFKRLREWGAPEVAEAAKDPSPRVKASQ